MFHQWPYGNCTNRMTLAFTKTNWRRVNISIERFSRWICRERVSLFERFSCLQKVHISDSNESHVCRRANISVRMILALERESIRMSFVFAIERISLSEWFSRLRENECLYSNDSRTRQRVNISARIWFSRSERQWISLFKSRIWQRAMMTLYLTDSRV